MEEHLSASGDELLAEIRSGVATVTLNRPEALNALSFGMIQGLAAWLEQWAADPGVRTVVLRGAGNKAFCAGGDVRALHAGFMGSGFAAERSARIPAYLEFFIAEYALDYRIHTYPKPVGAVMDGIAMGGGMGLSQGASLRIVGDRTKMAMPETTIGLFPDVGGSYFLSRAPGRTGIYLGLTGANLRHVDAIYCGLADLYVGEGMQGPGEIERLRPAIDEHFALPGVEAIVASLETERRAEYRDWAVRTREALAKKSPTMLAVTLEQLRRGATMTLADCFRMELNLIRGSFEQGDFIEGIRALIVEKDNRAQWNPPRQADVTRASVEAFFAPRWAAADHPLASLGI